MVVSEIGFATKNNLVPIEKFKILPRNEKLKVSLMKLTFFASKKRLSQRSDLLPKTISLQSKNSKILPRSEKKTVLLMKRSIFANQKW